ncbi:Cytochrome c553 [Sulfurivirga caldicuralii]|uniref:Cytochrome c553 n=1 Tax=Sulfurivirga caldicuralii TaxID=364032 RepID=A0A1N6DSY2_9GAMM|nr:c-type cytochrome [Sulfurivirga caldicuralii]SIN73918.1 Cytochrome c553 [Sulfurivirga caldicuralii]
MKQPVNKTLWLSSAFALLLPASAMADINMFARTTGDTCFACHGPNGKGVPGGSIPPIAGKDAGYLAQTMKDFRSGKRPSTIMQRHAKGYTDAEIETIAQYLSQIK